MSAKIITYGSGITAGSTAIPDNVEVALDIETTAGEDWILIDTENGAEAMTLAGGNFPVKIGTASRGPQLRQGHAGASQPGFPVYTFRGDTNTGMTDTGTADELSLVVGGVEGIRVVKDASSSKIMVGINGAPEDQNNPVLQLTGDGSEAELIIRRNTLSSSNDEVAYLGYRAQGAFSIDAEGGIQFRNQGGSKRAEFDSSGNFTTYHTTAVSGAALSTVGALGTALTSGSVSAGSSGSPSTTLAGSGTVFRTDFHVGAAIKVGSVITTVTAIASDTGLTLQDAIDTATTGTTCTRDGGELFAVKTGDSKTLFSVQPTGAIGAGANAGTTTGVYNNLGIGDPTMFDKLTTGNALFVMGNQSGDYDFTTANSAVIIGYNAGAASVNSQNLVAIGTYSADTDTNISDTVCIGTGSGRVSGNNSVHIGHQAGTAATGTDNVSIGHDALLASGSQANCVAIGSNALALATNNNNIGVGKNAGNAITTGSSNICIGGDSDVAATASNQIAIGLDSVTNAANKIRLGNTSITNIDGEVAFNATSDARTKTNVQELTLGLDFINALRPVSFTRVHPAEYPDDILDKRYKQGREVKDEDGNVSFVSTPQFNVETGQPIKDEFDETTRSDGLIAQEVQAVCDSLGVQFNGINTGNQGKLGMQYGLLVSPLIKAVQELTARVAELEAGD
tara:strand:+ start:669 stop:2705 length:2037 start_codon:yes stop_codon:yes gene_type:complete